MNKKIEVISNIDDALIILIDAIEGRRHDLGLESSQAWQMHIERIREQLETIH